MRSCLAPLAPTKPSSQIPRGLVDTHCHIVGPEGMFPFAEGRSYTPPDAPLEDYLALRNALSIERSVIVQPGAHGFDNRVTLDALAHLGGAALGIAVVPIDISDAALVDLHAGGIRGVRLSSMLRGEAGLDGFDTFARRVAPLGWQIVLHLHEADELLDLEAAIRGAPVPVVVDHMARATGERGVGSPAFQCLLRLLRDCSYCWTKVCSWYRLSSRPDWSDMAPLARAVLETAADRVLWGSNWPHVLMFDPPVPNDAALLDWFLDVAGPDARRVLVDNPVRLYDFRDG